MASPQLPEDQQRLIECLRQEAWASRPGFSTQLHERLVRAVVEQQTALGAARAKPFWARAWMALVGAAAALVAAVGVWLWGHTPLQTPSGSPKVQAVLPAPQDPTTPAQPAEPAQVRPALPAQPNAELVLLPDQPLEDLGAAMERQMRGGQWAYLEHDARVATALLLDHLPLDLAQSDPRPAPGP